MLIAVRLTPRGGRDALDGVIEIGGRMVLKARVAAPPVSGAANRALCQLLARAIGVPQSSVSIVSGASARVKSVAVVGLAEAAVEQLSAALPVKVKG